MQNEEMAQWGECLSFRYEDLSSDLQHPSKQWSIMAVFVCNSRLEVKGPRSLLASQSRQLVSSRFSQQHYLQNKTSENTQKGE